MKKKLPELYINKITKKITNNDKIFYSVFNGTAQNNNYDDISRGGTEGVKEKIDQMFDSPNYVYKMSATITLKDQSTTHKDIIGMMNNKLITIDEELIDIDDIRDIRF